MADRGAEVTECECLCHSGKVPHEEGELCRCLLGSPLRVWSYPDDLSATAATDQSSTVGPETAPTT